MLRIKVRHIYKGSAKADIVVGISHIIVGIDIEEPGIIIIINITTAENTKNETASVAYLNPIFIISYISIFEKCFKELGVAGARCMLKKRVLQTKNIVFVICFSLLKQFKKKAKDFLDIVEHMFYNNDALVNKAL